MGAYDPLDYSPFKEEPLRSMRRGALGGMLGGTFWLWLMAVFFEPLLFVYNAVILLTLYLLPFTGIVGALAGLYVHKKGSDGVSSVGAYHSPVYATNFALIFSLALWVIIGALTRTLQFWSIIYVLLFGIFVGGVAGLIIGRGQQTAK